MKNPDGKNLLVVRPFAGLGNRLRAIDSAVGLARKGMVSLELVWNKNKECNASFRKLFQVPDFITVKEISTPFQDNGRIFHARRALMNFFNLEYPTGFDRVMYDGEILQAQREGYDFSQLLNYKRIFLNSTSRFYANDHPFDYLSPVPEVRDKVGSLTSRFSDYPIGVHIRRGDNDKSTRYSPLQLFLNKMQQEYEKNNRVRFFLATDSMDVEKQIRKAFGEAVITHPKVLDRKKEQAIQDALVDMLCLSNTLKVYGSYWSSFSGVAAEMGDIELETLRS